MTERKAEYQDIERDLLNYKHKLREIQVQVIELLAQIDFDCIDRRKASGSDQDG